MKVNEITSAKDENYRNGGILLLLQMLMDLDLAEFLKICMPESILVFDIENVPLRFSVRSKK